MWGCVSPSTTSGRSHRVLVSLPGIALFSQPSSPHLVFVSVCYLTHACPCRLLNSCRVINNQVCFQAKEVRAPCTVRLFRTQRPILHLLIMWALSMWCDAGVHRVRGGLPSDMQQSALHSERAAGCVSDRGGFAGVSLVVPRCFTRGIPCSSKFI